MPWLLVGALVFAALTGVQGYRMGRTACEADHKQELLDQIEAGEKLEQARRQAAKERDALARELEGAAYADPVTSEQCLGSSRVRRLNSIR